MVVIFCHGAGDTGFGAQRWVESLSSKLDIFQWEYPSARPIPYGLAGGEVMSVWYDRTGDSFDPRNHEHTQSIDASVEQIENIVKSHEEKGVPRNMIAVGGFSMGGGIGLQAAARIPGLAAVFALSSYLCDDSLVYSAKELPPIFMSHGLSDRLIDPAWGKNTADRLRDETGARVEFVAYPGVPHEMNEKSIDDVIEFLRRVAPSIAINNEES